MNTISDAKYWDEKYRQNPITYMGRRVPNHKDAVLLDVRRFINLPDAYLEYIVAEHQLRDGSFNRTAELCQAWVADEITYSRDIHNVQHPEFWQFSFETLATRRGDCEDGAILMAALMRTAGIPAHRVKVAAGNVIDPHTNQKSGHAYVLYLADMPTSERGAEWVICDWCYYQDAHTPIPSRPLAKNGGFQESYPQGPDDLWFTFNDQHAWAPAPVEAKSAR